MSTQNSQRPERRRAVLPEDLLMIGRDSAVTGDD
jgi:hypothetical protein